MKIQSLSALFLILLIMISAPLSTAKIGKSQLNSDDPFKTTKENIEYYKTAGSTCEFTPEDVKLKNRALTYINYDFDFLNRAYSDATSAYDDKPGQIEKTQIILDLNQQLMDAAQTIDICVFKTKLDQQIKSLGNDPNYQRFTTSLKDVSNCIRGGADHSNQKIKKSMLSVFEDIFDYFWNKKSSLNDQDCEVLKSTYSVWSSFYDDENKELFDKKNTGSIPVYNVNDHNSSQKYWAIEQNKGNVPAQGLTIFHADTHTDLQHVHDHTSYHWTSDIVGLRDIQKLLNKDDATLKKDFIQMVNQSKTVFSSDKQSKIDRINQTPIEQLRIELRNITQKNINDIAQPLAAAQLTGVNNGRFIMCMPPWSQELPRTTKDKPILAKFQENSRGAYGHQITEEEYKRLKSENGGKLNSLVTEYVPYEPNPEKPPLTQPNSQFHVVDCNNEQRKVINPSLPADQQKFITEQRTTPLPELKDFFTTEEEKNGFILDIDLDAFVSEGHGTISTPYSFERPEKKVIPQGSEHGSHEKSSETDPRTEVSTTEFDLIKTRIDSLFSRLDNLKKAGVSPKVITIADSTALSRMMRARYKDEHNGKWSAYTPDCMTFLLNFMVRKQLKETYPEVVFPGQ